MKSLRTTWIVCVSGLLLLAGCMCQATGTESSEVKRMFRKPTRDYSTGPLWVWNDMLTEQQIRDTLRELASQEVKQVWVHPRPGLMTPYLGEDWFRLWKVALEEAERLDMNVWIYDENSYPSGFAGGLVPEAMPESRGRGLILKEVSTTPKWSDDLVAVYQRTDNGFENVTDKVRHGQHAGAGKLLVASEVRASNSPWHGNRSYVNLLSPGVTEKFIEVTLEPYRERLGSMFGTRIPGVFTDEPNIRPVGGSWPWSETLLADFQARWGYDLTSFLPELREATGDWRKTRHHYFQLLHELFVERWARPHFEYCQSNRLEWTGHYWDHEWPECVGVPDNMAMYAWHQRPAIDCLMNQYAEHTHAQFGNIRMVKELSSVANQLGWRRTLCEIYGAGGWDLRFEDMKRIGDWLEVLGVNTLNQHLTFTTLRGARKRDHPQSFSYHDPWWEAYHVSAGYFARLSAALSSGQQVNRVMVLQPTTTAWMYQGDHEKLGRLGSSFFQLLVQLEAAQIEYDLASEDIILRHGGLVPDRRTGATALKIGNRKYDRVVLPAFTENLNRKTAELLRAAKPLVFMPGPHPCRMDGELRDDVQDFFAHPAFAADRLAVWTRDTIQALREKQQSDGFAIDRTPGDKGLLFHHRRVLKDGELLLLVNTSIDYPSRGVVLSSLNGAENWDAYTGKTAPLPFTRLIQGVSVSFDLPPCGSQLIFLSQKPTKPVAFPAGQTNVITAIAPLQTHRLEPNVLVLDHVDVTAGEETRVNTYFYQANHFVWQKNGMDRNPWDSAVQFKDELISKTFPPGSGFEATYKFVIGERVPEDLDLVIERPDLYSIRCNGSPVAWERKSWWLDRAFGRMRIADLARAGENEITLKASPFTMYHELEPAYLLGSFSLESAPKGFVIEPEKALELGATTSVPTHSGTPERTMWLSAGVGFGGGTDDRAPWLVFDLGAEVSGFVMNIWNYSETYVRDLTSRGVSRMRLTGATAQQPEEFSVKLGTFDLAKATPGDPAPELIRVQGPAVRFVRLEVLANHAGVAFPCTTAAEDNAFVGLAEIQFLNASSQKLDSVSVACISSEFRDRRAVCLLDGSGLMPKRNGWSAQGHPFYGAGVVYRGNFDVNKKRGMAYRVALGEWLGAVAKVSVNGKPAGYIDAPPWECEVGSFLRNGSNEIEVTVFGTLKNLLGPHHGNPSLGAAWPSAFHRAPEGGLPPGNRYHTVAYGMFSPFDLREVAR